MERSVRILDILSAQKSVKVNLLAEILEVSHVTIRKDLDILEKRGIIHRTHGYASLNDTDDTGKRMAFDHSVKRRIAKAAAATVEAGETIMIESGSCCALFAEELAISQKNVTIVTNSAFITNYICRLPNIKIILLGGYFQTESHVLVGPMTARYGETFFSDKFFLGADGFVPGSGFTGRDYLRVQTVAELAKRAKRIYILTEAAKFSRSGVCNRVLRFDRIAGVFTDESIPREAEVNLLENNVPLYKVPAVAPHIAHERKIKAEFP